MTNKNPNVVLGGKRSSDLSFGEEGRPGTGEVGTSLQLVTVAGLRGRHVEDKQKERPGGGGSARRFRPPGVKPVI